MNFITFISEYWYVILLSVLAITALAVMIYKFVKAPKETQIKIVSEWLKYAVVLAESEFGSGTGQLKLRMVYNLFISKFPDVAKILPFETFSSLVDEALEWMNTQIESNKSIESLITNTPKSIETKEG